MPKSKDQALLPLNESDKQKTALAAPDTASIDAVLGNLEFDQTWTDLQKSITLGKAIVELNRLVDGEMLDNIIALRGTKLGFRTDRDKKGEPYSREVVKKCVIQALIIGLSPMGNQMNIYGGELYCTLEGYTALNGRISDLVYTFEVGIPRIIDDGSFLGADVSVRLDWVFNNGNHKKDLTFRIKGDRDKFGKHCTGIDSYMSKGERRAKKWLYFNCASGIALPTDDDDISEDIEPENNKESMHQNYLDIVEDIGFTKVHRYLVKQQSLTDTQKVDEITDDLKLWVVQNRERFSSMVNQHEEKAKLSP